MKLEYYNFNFIPLKIIAVFFVLFAVNSSIVQGQEHNNQESIITARDSLSFPLNDSTTISVEEIEVVFFHMRMLMNQQQYVIQRYLKVILALSVVALIFLIIVFRWVYKRYTSPKFPVVRHKKGYHPGIVCILMLCRFYGVRTNYKKLAGTISKDITQELTMADLAELAGKINFMAKGFKCDFRQLVQDSYLPSIVYLPNHFAIVYRITEKYVYLADPFYGLLKLELYYFVSGWYTDEKNQKGVILSIYPSNTLKIKNQVNLDLQKIEAQKEWNPKLWESLVCSTEIEGE